MQTVILDLIRSDFTARTCDEIATYLGLDHFDCESALHALFRSGQIHRIATDDGDYKYARKP